MRVLCQWANIRGSLRRDEGLSAIHTRHRKWPCKSRIEELNLDILLMLKVTITLGAVFAAASWVFYFWFRRQRQKEEERINQKLDIF